MSERPPVETLIVGHVTRDLAPDGSRLGGSAAYSSLTARALGREVGVVTAVSSDLDLSELSGVHVHAIRSSHSTTFENTYTDLGRDQRVTALADELGFEDVPVEWRVAPLVHLAPVANEVARNLVEAFRESYLGLTPQGWMRAWDEQGRVTTTGWRSLEPMLARATSVVLSLEDLGPEAESAPLLAELCRTLVVTQSERGVIVHEAGQSYELPAPRTDTVDATGAGDIFAAAFFDRHRETGDALAAASFANRAAAASLARAGLDGVPTPDELEAFARE